MKKCIAFLLIIAMLNSLVCYADVMDSEELEIIMEDDSQSHENELDIQMSESEVHGVDELILDDIAIEDSDLIELEPDTELAGNASTPLLFPVKIGNINGIETEFYKSLEYYITNTESDKYNPGLAHMLVALAGAAYNEQKEDGQSGLLTPENAGYKSKSKELRHITKAYKDLGFDDYQVFNYYNNPDDRAYGEDNVAFSIGRKQLSDDDALVLIVVRGSCGKLPDFEKKDLTVSSDWQSNFKIKTNSKGWHLGFARAADKVYSALKSFLKNRQYSDAAMKSNVRYVITGHSRGAAVANLLAVKLHDEKVPNSKVYDYNFACPDTVKGFKLANLKRNHENIFNICNSADLVSFIPGVIGDAVSGVGYVGVEKILKEKYKSLFVSWGKYGTTWFYCKNWNDPKEFDLTRTFRDVKKSPHDTKYYIPDIGKNTYKFYSRKKIVARGIYLGVKNRIDDIINVIYPQYFIAPEDIVEAKVTVKDQVYTGKALKPDVSVILNKKTLKKGTDYSVSYKNNKNIGTATVTVTGKGSYTGTKKATFSINPKAVTGFALSAGDKQITASWKKVTGVTGYQIQYDVKKDFTSANNVTIKNNSTKNVIKGLSPGETYYARIRSYKTVNKKKFYSAWSGVKKAKTSGTTGTTIQLDKESLSLNVGDTYQLTCFVTEGVSGSVQFSSSNAAVATVDANALITAVGVGEATITASMDNGATATCEVTVSNSGVPTSITINDGDTLTLSVGQTYKLKAVLEPSTSTAEIHWMVDRDYRDVSAFWTDFLTVSADGVITALKEGTIPVFAMTKGVDNKTLQDKIQVTIVPSNGVTQLYSDGILKLLGVINEHRENNTHMLTINPDLCELAKQQLENKLNGGSITLASGEYGWYYHSDYSTSSDGDDLLYAALNMIMDTKSSVRNGFCDPKYHEIGIATQFQSPWWEYGFYVLK